jgi:hypothetical protein
MTIFYDDNNVQKHEKDLILQRRVKVPKLDPKAPTVGFALSGGGIRSATFCLGIFQAIAKQIDSKIVGRNSINATFDLRNENENYKSTPSFSRDFILLVLFVSYTC